MPERVYADAEWSLAEAIAAEIVYEYRLHVDVTCLAACVAKVIVETAEAAEAAKGGDDG